MHLSRNESWVLLLDFLPKFRVAYLAVFRQHYCEVILINFFSIGLIGLSDSFNENQTRWQGRHEETFPPPPPRAFIFGSPVLKFMCQSRTVFLQNNARSRVLKVLDLLFCSGFVRLAGKTKMQYFSFPQVSQKNKENLSMKLHKVLAWEPQVLGLKKRLVILHIFILICLGAGYMEGETS